MNKEEVKQKLMAEVYNEADYDIRVYKEKGLDKSIHVISGERPMLLTGLTSLILSYLQNNIMSVDELDFVVESVKCEYNEK